MTAASGRHQAPDVGLDPATDPRLIRAGWIADHGTRLLPADIRTRRYPTEVRPRIPDHLRGADRMGGGQDVLSDYLYLKGEL